MSVRSIDNTRSIMHQFSTASQHQHHEISRLELVIIIDTYH